MSSDNRDRDSTDTPSVSSEEAVPRASRRGFCTAFNQRAATAQRKKLLKARKRIESALKCNAPGEKLTIKEKRALISAVCDNLTHCKKILSKLTRMLLEPANGDTINNDDINSDDTEIM